jgi:hypothetical protein
MKTQQLLEQNFNCNCLRVPLHKFQRSHSFQNRMLPQMLTEPLLIFALHNLEYSVQSFRFDGEMHGLSQEQSTEQNKKNVVFWDVWRVVLVRNDVSGERIASIFRLARL